MSDEDVVIGPVKVKCGEIEIEGIGRSELFEEILPSESVATFLSGYIHALLLKAGQAPDPMVLSALRALGVKEINLPTKGEKMAHLPPNTEPMNDDEKRGNTGGMQPGEFKRQKGRSVKISYKWFDKEKNEVQTVNHEKATFHCWGLRVAKSSDERPKIMASETIGVCELEDGRMKLIAPERIIFTDRLPKKEVADADSLS